MRTLAKLVQLHTPQTGLYEITDPCKTGQQITQLIQVQCDLETDGGGWTVILHRKYSSGPRENFIRGWDDYENGFGDPTNEFWLGLRYMHCLTQRDDMDLIIDLKTVDGNGMTWFYDCFKVAGSNDKYRLTIGNGIGPAYGYDAMAHLNNSQFSTQDSDNDQREDYSIAQVTYFGGWWHTSGYYVQLTGIGNRNFWYNGKGNREAYLSTDYSHYDNNIIEMKIRPKSCSIEC